MEQQKRLVFYLKMCVLLINSENHLLRIDGAIEKEEDEKSKSIRFTLTTKFEYLRFHADYKI